jgi:hypothetical protein
MAPEARRSPGRQQPAHDDSDGARAWHGGVDRDAQIRSLVAAEEAVLVDLFPLCEGKIDTLIGPDGLHPTQEGYQAMAEAFFAAIRERLELRPRRRPVSFSLHWGRFPRQIPSRKQAVVGAIGLEPMTSCV